jgi:hypothetical protein
MHENGLKQQTMRAPFFVSPTHPKPMAGRGRCMLALSLALLTLFAIISSNLHHHSDLAEHPDCVVCDFTHHAKTTALTSPTPGAVILLFLSVLFTPPLLTAPLARTSLLLPSRAPPALTSATI